MQFHPESIASEYGHAILANFLSIAGLNPKRRTSSPRVSPREGSQNTHIFRRSTRIDLPMPSATLKTLIHKVADAKTFSADEMRSALEIMTEGHATHAQMGAFLMALRVRGETVDEIDRRSTNDASSRCCASMPLTAPSTLSAPAAMHHGTYQRLNLSSLVAAGAGLKIAKHGNRSVSSLAGASDVLSALGDQSRCQPMSSVERLHQRSRRRLPVCTKPSPRHEKLGACPCGTRRPHHLQFVGSNLQSRRRQTPNHRCLTPGTGLNRSPTS